MNKRRFLIAATAAIVGVIVHRNLKTSTPTVLEPPELSPELQKWVDYVDEYPNLEDDPKIARAIEVLNETEDPE